VDVYLPVAEVSVNLFTFLGLGGIVGLLSGLFGVGGGFLLTPLLIMMGIPPTVAAASDSNQIVASSSSGAYAHSRARNVDFKMGALLLLGSFPGGFIGVQLIKLLRTMGDADFAIKLTYVVVLGGIGAFMFVDSLKELRGRPKLDAAPDKPKPRSAYGRFLDALPFKMEFPHSKVTLSVLVPLLLGLTVGTLAAVMGVGGGFIMVPAMVYLLGMPMHAAIGTDLFQIVFACINVTILQAHVNHTVDFVLALTLLAGSVFGAQVGARLSRFLRGEQLKIILAGIVLVVMVKMLYGLLATPDVLLAHKGGHGGSEHSVVKLEETEAVGVDTNEFAAAGVEMAVTPSLVDITMSYSGKDLAVEATVPAGMDVAVKCEGPRRQLELSRKGKAQGLLWMNVGDLTFDSVPDLYMLRTSAPLATISSHEAQKEFLLGYDALREAVCSGEASPEASRYFTDLVKFKERDGLFSVSESAVTLTPGSDGTQRVTAELRLPSRASPTNYRVELYGLEDGEATLLAAKPVRLNKVGAVRTISSLAQNRGLLYGVVAVFIALCAGLAAGFIFKGGKAH